MDQINENIDYHLLISKVISNEATEAEKKILDAWLIGNEENKEVFLEYNKAYELTHGFPYYGELNLESEWSRMNSYIEAKDNKIIGRKKVMANLVRIAAIFILALVAGVIAFNAISGRDVRFKAGGAIAQTILPDGSIITLNKGSELSYSQSFNVNDSRNVKLSGEAFFDVHRDEEKPFIIDAGDISVKVLGTSFNVSSLNDSTNVEVTVKSGKVEVVAVSSKKVIVIKAGEKAVYNRNTKELVKMLNDDDNYLSWKTKVLVFRNVKMKRVLKKLENVYNVTFNVSQGSIEECNFNSTLDNKSLEEILNLLQATYDVNIVQKDKLIEISGGGC